MKILILFLLLMVCCEPKIRVRDDKELPKAQYIRVNNKDSINLFWGRVDTIFDTVQV